MKSLENPEFTKDWVPITPDKLQEINDSGKLIDKEGFIKEDLEGGKNIPLKDLDNVKWRSGGEFILDADGESIYYYNKNIKVSKGEDGSAIIPDDNDKNNGGDLDGNSGENQNDDENSTEGNNPEYPIIHPNGDSEEEDGTITKPDGTIIKPDGTIIHPDGTIIHPDGRLVHLSRKMTDGEMTFQTRFADDQLPSETLKTIHVFKNGILIKSTNVSGNWEKNLAGLNTITINTGVNLDSKREVIIGNNILASFGSKVNEYEDDYVKILKKVAEVSAQTNDINIMNETLKYVFPLSEGEYNSFFLTKYIEAINTNPTKLYNLNDFNNLIAEINDDNQ